MNAAEAEALSAYFAVVTGALCDLGKRVRELELCAVSQGRLSHATTELLGEIVARLPEEA